MNDRNAEHPTQEQLVAFSRQALNDQEWATVEGHVAACEPCLQVLETLPDDPLFAAVCAATAGAFAGDTRLRVHAGYEILEEIGRGGMGVVFKARQPGLGRLVALKRIHAGRETRPESLARFRREADAVARLDHPNIVRIYEVGEQDGQPYLALEYVAGGTLRERLAGNPLVPAAAADLVETLARAIAHAHQAGIVHRDLKPANVLLQPLATKSHEDKEGEPKAGSSDPSFGDFSCLSSPFLPKITDFGLAKLLDNEAAQTQTGDVLGTPAYMAPEQAAGPAHAVGRAADVYALGAILYEALTGRPPFQGATVLDTLEQVRTQEPVPPSRLQPKVPRDLETICLKCLQKEPAQRYRSALALADDLHRFRGGEPIVARPVGPLRRAVKWARRRPAVAGLLAALLAVTCLGLGLVLWQWREAVEALAREDQARAGRAQAKVQALLKAAPQAVPAILQDLESSQSEVLPRLRQLWEQPGLAERERLRAGLGLLASDPAAVKDRLYARMLADPDPAEVLLLRDALRPHGTEFSAGLWRLAEAPATPAGKRFRALVVLAAFDAGSPRWQQAGAAAVEQLLNADRLHLGNWADGLRPVHEALLRPLAAAFRGRQAEQRLVAASLLADYAANRPALLVELALDADARQHAMLLTRLKAHRDTVVPLLEAEIARQPTFDWKDAPLSDFSRPRADLVRQVEAAHGLVADRFALCQDLPLGQLRAVTDGLGRSGYRPVRVRPYTAGANTLVAVVWTRDGRPWRLTLDTTATALQELSDKQRREGFMPGDVAAYGPDGEHYAALWEKGARGEQRRLLLGVPDAKYEDAGAQMAKDNLAVLTVQVVVRNDGQTRLSWVLTNAPVTVSMGAYLDRASYLGGWRERLPVDICLMWRANVVRAVRRELQAWLSGSPGAGAAGLPWAALYRRSQTPLVGVDSAQWYFGAWEESTKMEGRRLDRRLGFAEHLRQCGRVLSMGYRPAALAVAAPAEGQPAVAISLWHRPVIPEATRDALASRQANAAVTLLHLGRATAVWPLLRHSPDPRRRTFLVHRLAALGVPPRLLTDRFNEEREVSVRRALLVSLGEYGEAALPTAERATLVPELLRLYRHHPDSGLHGAVDWLLRRWGQGTTLAQIDRELAGSGPQQGQGWYVNGQLQTLALVAGPRLFLMGSPVTEAGRLASETLHYRVIPRSFALATRPVTVAQFEEFLRAHPDVPRTPVEWTREPQCPIMMGTWHKAAMYCQWLSEREGVPRRQWCYPSVARMKALVKAGMDIPLPADYLSRTGYRLPTEAEWECACRAGAVTSRYFGGAPELLGEYAWCQKNSAERMRPVGLLKPNDLGLFDMYGNAWQQCQDRYVWYPPAPAGGIKVDTEDTQLMVKPTDNRVLRGGTFFDPSLYLRSACRNRNLPGSAMDSTGLRVARTYR
jgi:formylglycine-generating enzyme required for sulfatase activity